MKADSEKIKWLLDNFSQYEISRATGVAQPSLSNIKSGTRKIENLSLKVASKLTEYAEELEMKREQEILDIIKEMELEADMLDIWENEDGDISIQSRGVVPADEKELSLKYVGYVDNGQVWFE
jgi:transcriptional regulator with XRE-family HTH domain